MTIATVMPQLFAHEGEWEGSYRHVTRDFTLADEHRTWTWCEFPRAGPFAYVQHNRLTWADGRVEERSFPGVYRDGLLHWDTDRFVGIGWETHGVLMLRLERKDVADASFVEMITIAADGQTRARTWQWFEQGRPTRRTLCDERRVA